MSEPERRLHKDGLANDKWYKIYMEHRRGCVPCLEGRSCYTGSDLWQDVMYEISIYREEPLDGVPNGRG